MQTQVCIDDMQLFVCEVIDKNHEEEYMEEIIEKVLTSAMNQKLTTSSYGTT